MPMILWSRRAYKCVYFLKCFWTVTWDGSGSEGRIFLPSIHAERSIKKKGFWNDKDIVEYFTINELNVNHFVKQLWLYGPDKTVRGAFNKKQKGCNTVQHYLVLKPYILRFPPLYGGYFHQIEKLRERLIAVSGKLKWGYDQYLFWLSQVQEPWLCTIVRLPVRASCP